MRMEKEKPVWLKMSEEDVITLIVKLAGQGMTSDKIGLQLRDTYGIPPSAILTKKIKKILGEKGIKEKPQDIENLVKRAEQLKKHLQKNKKDIVAKRGLQLTESKILSLEKYYKKKGMLPSDWKH